MILLDGMELERHVLPAAQLGLCYRRLATDSLADALNIFEVIASKAPGPGCFLGDQGQVCYQCIEEQ